MDIFVNAGQVVTGNLAPYFLTVCKPNYTALGCQQALRYISHQEACTGNQDDILRARKTFPSKEAALSIYAALYLAVSSRECLSFVHSKGGKPVDHQQPTSCRLLVVQVNQIVRTSLYSLIRSQISQNTFSHMLLGDMTAGQNLCSCFMLLDG